MNKTLTVNIAGLVFHIEENAYKKLFNYLEAVKASITSEEREEVIRDIELRIAEIFSEKISDFNQVILLKDVEDIILIMGKPEDYNIDGETEDRDIYYTFPKVRKLYRDKQNAILGGVLAGLGHYFRVDVVWLRIIALILLFFYGFGVLLYIILWIVIPKAKTTTQILEMTGEPINISSIERKVKENMDYVSKKINSIDYQKIKSNAEETTSQTLEIVKRFIGVVLLIVSFTGLLGAIFSSVFIIRNFNMDSTVFPDEFILLFSNDLFPLWFSAMNFSFALIVPFVICFLIGLKLLYSNIKYIGAVSVVLIVLWFISCFMMAFPLTDLNKLKKLETVVHVSDDMKSQKSMEINIPTDTLHFAIVDPAFFKTDSVSYKDYEVLELPKDTPIEIEFASSFQDEPYVVFESKFTKKEMRKKYNRHGIITIPNLEYRMIENTLVLSNQFVYKDEETSNQSKTSLIVYLPKDKLVFIPENLKPIIDDSDELTAGDHYYKMTGFDLQCTDCP